jgi:hypothetical protein
MVAIRRIRTAQRGQARTLITKRRPVPGSRTALHPYSIPLAQRRRQDRGSGLDPTVHDHAPRATTPWQMSSWLLSGHGVMAATRSKNSRGSRTGPGLAAAALAAKARGACSNRPHITKSWNSRSPKLAGRAIARLGSRSQERAPMRTDHLMKHLRARRPADDP